MCGKRLVREGVRCSAGQHHLSTLCLVPQAWTTASGSRYPRIAEQREREVDRSLANVAGDSGTTRETKCEGTQRKRKRREGGPWVFCHHYIRPPPLAYKKPPPVAPLKPAQCRWFFMPFGENNGRSKPNATGIKLNNN